MNPTIRNVLLAAPDADVGLAWEAILDMGPRAQRPRFTLFVSQHHRAAITAPAAIVDPKPRRVVGEHAKGRGRSVEDVARP